MNILSETNGQSCNKFFQYLYYLKQAINSNERLFIQMPDVTVNDYPNLCNNKYTSFPFYSSRLTRLIGLKRSLKLTQFITVAFLNNYVRFLLHQLSFRKLNFLSGKPTWTGTDETYTDIRDVLNNLFSLREDLKIAVDSYFPSDEYIVCGVHMRGGDYREWLGGKYFFGQNIYRKAMNGLQSLLPNKKVIFFICSNEPINEQIFRGINYFSIQNSSASQDIYALSRCNYMIGTLSSFNAWASLIGDVPLYTILKETDADNIQLNDFSPVVNYKRKANGWKFPRSTTFFTRLSHPWLYRHSNKEYLLDLKYD